MRSVVPFKRSGMRSSHGLRCAQQEIVSSVSIAGNVRRVVNSF